jgi:TonB-dependent receptor
VKSFKHLVMYSAVVGAIASPAFAQESEIDEVVVTGIRASLAAAVDIKRNNVGVVDAITAEDMGKFPDGNLAEALSRLVGVAIDRSNIEGSKIAVRGFGPEFNLVTLNGRQMPTVPGRYNGGRSFDFGDISAHGFESVQVFKTPTAVLPTGGIGSTVNIVTSKPLNAPGFKGAVSYALVDDSTNPDGGTDSEMDIVLSNTFLDGMVGISLSGSHSERNNREEGLQETTWFENVLDRAADGAVIDTSANLRADGTTFSPEKAGFQIKDNNRVRDNAQLTMQFRPVDTFTATLDYTWSNLDFSTTGNTFGTYLGGWNMATGTVNENGVVVDSTYTDGSNVSYGQSVTMGEEENTNKSFGINLEWQATENLTLTLDAHDSSAKKVGTDGDNSIGFINGNWAGYGNGNGNVYDQAASVELITASFGTTGVPTYDLDVTNGYESRTAVDELLGSDMGSTNGTSSAAFKKNGMQQVQLHGDWVNTDGLFTDSLKSVQFGISRTQQKINDMRARTDFIQGAANDGTDTVLSFIFFEDEIFTRTSLEGFMDDGSNGTNPENYYLAMDVDAAADAFARAGWGPDAPDAAWWAGNYGNCDIVAEADGAGFGETYNPDASVRGDYECDLNPGDIDTHSVVREVLESAHAQFNFETEVQGMPLNVTAGLRWEQAETFSNDLSNQVSRLIWNVDTAGVMQIEREGDLIPGNTGKYNHILPSLSMSLAMSDNEVVRFGLHRAIARAGMNDLRSAVELGDTRTIYEATATGGNAALKPLIADSLDLAYENYYAEGSYFAINYFRKNLKDFIGSAATSETIGNVQDPTAGVAGLWGKENPSTTSGQGWVDEDVNKQVWWAAAGGEPTAYDGLNVWDGWWQGTNGDEWKINNPAEGDPLALFDIARPRNLEEGTVDGWEIALQHQFGDTGFGFNVNATFVGGDVKADRYATGDQFALPGFGDSANLAAFYEDDKWTATIAYNERGETFAGLEGQNHPIFIEERYQIDMTASYNVSDNFTVFAEARNITDEPVRLFVRYPEMIFLAQDHGPMYKFGVRARF